MPVASVCAAVPLECGGETRRMRETLSRVLAAMGLPHMRLGMRRGAEQRHSAHQRVERERVRSGAATPRRRSGQAEVQPTADSPQPQR